MAVFRLRLQSWVDARETTEQYSLMYWLPDPLQEKFSGPYLRWQLLQEAVPDSLACFRWSFSLILLPLFQTFLHWVINCCFQSVSSKCLEKKWLVFCNSPPQVSHTDPAHHKHWKLSLQNERMNKWVFWFGAGEPSTIKQSTTNSGCWRLGQETAQQH